MHGNYTTCFTELSLIQICEHNKDIPGRDTLEICATCRDTFLGIGPPYAPHDRIDDCLVRGMRASIAKRNEEIKKDTINKG